MSDIKPKQPVSLHVYGEVLDFEGFKAQRALATHNKFEGCRHSKTAYSTQERRIWCQDCMIELEPFDVLTMLLDSYSAAIHNLEVKKKQFIDDRNKALRSIAAKSFDDIYRSRNDVPACPHCKEALLPEDVTSGALPRMDKVLARKRRESEKVNK